jgi:hypothetical protein
VSGRHAATDTELVVRQATKCGKELRLMRKRTFVIRTAVLIVTVGLIYGGINLADAATPSGIAGQVTVMNTPSSPVPVTGTVSTNTPSLQPVESVTRLQGSDDIVATADLYTVPAGKELVVDEVTVYLAEGTPDPRADAEFAVTNAGDASRSFFVAVELIGNFAGSFEGSAHTQFYAGPGATLSCRLEAGGDSGVNPNKSFCAFAGHLVDAS